MPRRVTSSDGGGRLDILLFLIIGGGACPAVVWAWPASLGEIRNLEDNMQLSRNDEYV